MNRETIVNVDLDARSYDIVIGRNLLENAPRHLKPLLKRQRVLVITDSTVAPLHLPRLTAPLERDGIRVEALTLPAGESSKSWDSAGHVVSWLLEQNTERSDLVVALGGGVIGDLAGFAAAILRRGVRFVQIPTTLLAQVDSSVGGKTGVNAPQGKNLIGAFHQPSLVLADIATLDTLPKRDFLAGYGEVVKYGLLGDEEFFVWLERHGPTLHESSNDNALIHAIRRSCEMKAGIVSRDEQEAGERALLNLGHTFGHALEAATGYSDTLLHGEGVAMGCAMAFELSARLGLCAQETPGRVRAHFAAMGLRYRLTEIAHSWPDAPTLAALMQHDKKVVNGVIRFVLARGVGHSFVTSDVPTPLLHAVLNDALTGSI